MKQENQVHIYLKRRNNHTTLYLKQENKHDMIQALDKYIIVKPIFKEQIGMILTTKKAEVQYHEVVSVGDKVSSINPGDKVYISNYALSEIPGEEELYSVLHESVYGKQI